MIQPSEAIERYTYSKASGKNQAESGGNVHKDVHFAHRLNDDTGRLSSQIII